MFSHDESREIRKFGVTSRQKIKWGLNGAESFLPRAELANATAGIKYLVMAIACNMCGMVMSGDDACQLLMTDDDDEAMDRCCLMTVCPK